MLVEAVVYKQNMIIIHLSIKINYWKDSEYVLEEWEVLRIEVWNCGSLESWKTSQGHVPKIVW